MFDIDDFCLQYNIVDLIFPKNASMLHIMSMNKLNIYFDNPNMVCLIIESMAIGIILNYHIATKFGYIQNVIKYNDFEIYDNNKTIIIIVSKKWSTHNWSYTKLFKFNNILEFIENKTVEDITVNIDCFDTEIKYSIDVNMLEGLSWNAYLEN